VIFRRNFAGTQGGVIAALESSSIVFTDKCTVIFSSNSVRTGVISETVKVNRPNMALTIKSC